REPGPHRPVEHGERRGDLGDEHAEQHADGELRHGGQREVDEEGDPHCGERRRHPGNEPGHPRFRAGLTSRPMPWIWISTVWPSTNPPSPAGVPVRIRSPGSSVQMSETNSMISGMLWIMSRVLP